MPRDRTRFRQGWWMVGTSMSTAKRQKVEHVSRSCGDEFFNHSDLVYNCVLDCLLPFELLTVRAINRKCRGLVCKYWVTDAKLPAYLRKAFEYFTGMPEKELVNTRTKRGFVTGPLLFNMMCTPMSQGTPPMKAHVYQSDIVFRNGDSASTMELGPWKELLGGTRFLQLFLRCDEKFNNVRTQHRLTSDLIQEITERRPTLVKYVAAWAHYGAGTGGGAQVKNPVFTSLIVANVTTTPLVFIAKQTPVGFFRCAFDGLRLLVHSPNDFIERTCNYRPRTYTSVSNNDCIVTNEGILTQDRFKDLGFEVNLNCVTHILKRTEFV